ncbi:MAG: sulfatase-like hydrolase/transferase [Acidobacteria bacterium]|nr:sulfatase-like hydrolase/transferase [Acidobacteriota bacterium]
MVPLRGSRATADETQPWPQPLRQLRVLAILTVLMLALAACGEKGSPPAAPPPRPPVFIISIDTLRADRLPAWGYADGQTPAIDAFRRDAILFRNAYSNVPVTLPSHASIFTGTLPHRHGVRDNIGYSLGAEARTLASALRDGGYRTGAAVSSFVLRRETGIGAGFDFYDDATTVAPTETISSWQRDGESTRRSLTRWLDEPSSAPPFGLLHIYEPHYPYTPPEPFASRFDDPYDGEVAASDEIVGRFLDDLRNRGLYDSALVILLSDHGEGLGDHGELEHGVFLYREAIQVPLLVKLPGNARAGEEVADPVSLTDIFPTVTTALGLGPGPALDGTDLLAVQAAERSIYSESWYPRLHYGWSELYSQVDSRYHFIEAPEVELYDHVTDPGETRNLAGEQRRVVSAMRSAIQEVVSQHPFEEPSATDPETLRKLASLGYLGGGGSGSNGPKPDPKEKIGLLTLFGRGAAHMQRAEYDEAVEIGRAIVAENPDFLQGWGLLAAAWREMGDVPRAIGALEAQMQRAPGNPQTALALSSLYLAARRFDDARAHAELALNYAPSLAWEAIAAVELGRRNLDAAWKAAESAAAAAPLRVQPLIVQSQVRRARQDPAGELALLDAVGRRVAAGEAPAVPELQLRRGEALLRLGRVPEAEAAFRAETERFPANVRAWANLALVIDAQGRHEQSREVLAKALEVNPTPAMRSAAREVTAIVRESAGAVRPGGA